MKSTIDSQPKLPALDRVANAARIELQARSMAARRELVEAQAANRELTARLAIYEQYAHNLELIVSRMKLERSERRSLNGQLKASKQKMNAELSESERAEKKAARAARKEKTKAVRTARKERYRAAKAIKEQIRQHSGIALV